MIKTKCLLESNSDGLRALGRGADRSPPHVSNREGRIRVLLTEVLGVAVVRIARATGASVQPVHVGGHVVPERDDEGHASLHSLVELLQSTIVVEVRKLLVFVNELVAPVLSHGITRAQAQVWELNLLAILVEVLVHAGECSLTSELPM